MEAVERIKDATFDINTIGLYDAELDRKWKEEAKMAYAKKLGIEEGQEKGREEGQFSIISTMLKNGITPKKVIEITGISLEKIKKMGLKSIFYCLSLICFLMISIISCFNLSSAPCQISSRKTPIPGNVSSSFSAIDSSIALLSSSKSSPLKLLIIWFLILKSIFYHLLDIFLPK